MMKRRAVVIALALLAFRGGEARAHLMPAHQGTLTIRDRQVYLAVSLSARLFAEADDDGDGMLSGAEAAAHAELLQRLVATRLHLTMPSTAARLLHASVVVERMDDDTAATPRPAADVLVLVVAAFDAPPANLTLRIDGLDALVGRDPEWARLTVRATRDGGAIDAASIAGGRSRMTFFRSGWRRTLHSVGDVSGLGGFGLVAALTTLAPVMGRRLPRRTEKRVSPEERVERPAARD